MLIPCWAASLLTYIKYRYILGGDTHELLYDWIIAYINREKLIDLIILRYENQYCTLRQQSLSVSMI